MNPPSFTSSSIAEYPQNFIGELQKVFGVIHVVDNARVKLESYKVKSVSRTWFDHWKGGRPKHAPPTS